MTEAAEWMLERLQAGAVLVDDEAREELWVVDPEFSVARFADIGEFAVWDELAGGCGVVGLLLDHVGDLVVLRLQRVDVAPAMRLFEERREVLS